MSSVQTSIGTNPWWTDFFSGLTVELQQRIASSQPTQQEATFLQSVLRVTPGQTIADLPCGDGRLSLELGRRGYRLRGVDISPGLVEAATRGALASTVDAQFTLGDMKEISWSDALDGAFCMGNSFAYFDDDGNQRFLEGVFRALRPGKRFLLQTNLVAESILTRPLPRTWYEFGDILFLHTVSYDARQAVLTSEYRFSRGETRETKIAHYRIYSLRELLGLLRSCGFRQIEPLGSLQGDNFRLGDMSLYLVCEK